MPEHRQNWRKFQKILGYVPAKAQGLLVVGAGKKLLAGAVTSSCQDLPHKDFSHQGFEAEHVENAWEILTHEYHAAGMTYIDRDELFTELASIAAIKSGKSSTDIFYDQVKMLRESLKLERGEKTKLASHFGDKPVGNFWPRENFFLGYFQSMFSDLLPERKILLLGIVEEDNSLSSIALEYQSSQLKRFIEPDWNNLEIEKDTDFFQQEMMARFVLWCENHYVLPTYGVFVTRKIWLECMEMQLKQGDRAAWKHLLQTKRRKDVEMEVLVEPEPWPMKAVLHWNSMKS